MWGDSFCCPAILSNDALCKDYCFIKGHTEKEAYTERLFAVGITNCISEETPEEITAKLLGFIANKPKPKPIAETPKEVWQAKDIKIAVAVVQHKSRTTVTAINLAYWPANHGASVFAWQLNNSICIFGYKKSKNFFHKKCNQYMEINCCNYVG